ncbi:hypothetical protein ABTE18_20665, partial [Acinetobacter baumannii]
SSAYPFPNVLLFWSTQVNEPADQKERILSSLDMRKTDMKEHAAGIRITVYITKVLVEGTSVLKSYQAALPARRGFAALTSDHVKL